MELLLVMELGLPTTAATRSAIERSGQLTDWNRGGQGGKGGAATGTLRAVEYVRMSTEHQKYSTENQADAIRQYASIRGDRDR